MFKVNIKNLNDEITHEAWFDSEEEANAWIASQGPIGAWGKPERELEESIALANGEDLESAVSSEERQEEGQEPKTFYLFDAEFTAEVEDIGDEIEMLKLRTKRNALLSECDWTQLADSPLSNEDKSAWAAYRQELRDLPENTEDPSDPEWPAKPE